MRLTQLELIVQTMRKLADERKIIDPNVEFYLPLTADIDYLTHVEPDADLSTDVENSMCQLDGHYAKEGDFAIPLRNVRRWWTFSCTQRDGSHYEFERRMSEDDARAAMKEAKAFYVGCIDWKLVNLENKA